MLDSFLITKQAPSYEYMKHHFYNCAILTTKYSEGLGLSFAVALKKEKNCERRTCWTFLQTGGVLSIGGEASLSH